MIHDTMDGRRQENDSAMKEKWYVKYLSVGAFLIRFWCQKVCPTVPFDAKENAERYKSQITLAKRRIKAFEIANWLIENELEK